MSHGVRVGTVPDYLSETLAIISIYEHTDRFAGFALVVHMKQGLDPETLVSHKFPFACHYSLDPPLGRQPARLAFLRWAFRLRQLFVDKNLESRFFEGGTPN